MYRIGFFLLVGHEVRRPGGGQEPLVVTHRTSYTQPGGHPPGQVYPAWWSPTGPATQPGTTCPVNSGLQTWTMPLANPSILHFIHSNTNKF